MDDGFSSCHNSVQKVNANLANQKPGTKPVVHMTAVTSSVQHLRTPLYYEHCSWGLAAMAAAAARAARLCRRASSMPVSQMRSAS